MRWISTLLLALTACGTASEPATRPAAAVPSFVPSEPRADAGASVVAVDEPVPAPDPWDALADELRALPFDPAPARTTNDTHYLVSNERRVDLFRPDIDGRGGLFVGVGTDQNYVMAGWSRPDLLLIVDFDLAVVDLHAIHGEFLKASPTVEAFRRLWSDEGRDDATALLRAAWDEGSPDARRRRALYSECRAEVDQRLNKLAERYDELSIHSYLDRPDEYAIVRRLFVDDRVVAIRGDYTKPGVVAAIGETLRAHGRTIDVLYLSNIEQYFAYRKPFKTNVLGLPFSDDTLVLRTLPGRPAGFQYMLQRGPDFHAWMRAPKVWSVYRVRGLPKGHHLRASERYFITWRPEDRDDPRPADPTVAKSPPKTTG